MMMSILETTIHAWILLYLFVQIQIIWSEYRQRKSISAVKFITERLRNENEDKTKTQMTQSFNQYSENETKIWRQNILNWIQSRVFVLSSFSFRNISNATHRPVYTINVFIDQTE